jgi:predicted dienelactone hydrolase
MRTWLAGLAAAAALAIPALGYAPAPGTLPVETILGTWTDPARDNREVPYKIYQSPQAACPCPLVLFSHGLGGSREGGAYLGEALAAHGYIAVHIQHPGSDESIWAGAQDRDEALETLSDSLRDPMNAVARFEDVPFSIDSLTAMNAAEGPLKGRLDLGRIGMSGHSYGAASTLVAAGQTLGRRGFSFKEPRIKAAIAYSPNKPERARDLDAAFADVAIPIFHMTGTKDGSPLAEVRGEDFDPAQRTAPYEHIKAAGQYLLVLKDGDHMVFGGRRRGGPAPLDAAQQALIVAGSLAFWDAHLKGEPGARAWLDTGGFAAMLGEGGTFERK